MLLFKTISRLKKLFLFMNRYKGYTIDRIKQLAISENNIEQNKNVRFGEFDNADHFERKI